MVLCKTITSDNDLKFSSIIDLENDTLQIFFAHPYAAWEHGSNKRHNTLLCRFIPKGEPIHTLSEATLIRATNCVIHCLEKSSVTIRRKRHCLAKSKSYRLQQMFNFILQIKTNLLFF